MSKHHRDQPYWLEHVTSGRTDKAASTRRGPKPPPRSPGAQGGPAVPGKPGKAGKPAQPLAAGTVRPDTPTERPPRVPTERPPQLDGQGLPYITLAQLLKKLNLVGSGGEAKATIRSGGIVVNGVAEERPGRKLHQGDKVTINGHDHTVHVTRMRPGTTTPN